LWPDINRLDVDARPFEGSDPAFPTIFPSPQGKLELAMKALHRFSAERMLREEYEACDKGFTPMTTAVIRRLAVPSPEELIDRARGMVPEIRALAEETERNRNVLPHIIDKIRDAELLRTCRPREFGGFEYDGETALRIALTISAACASTGWAVNGAVSNGRSIAHFPIEAQREVWDGNEDPFTCACFAPTGTAVPVDGGYVLSGAWSFASGCDASSWVKLGAFITPQDATPPFEGAFFLLPIGDCEIVDNWFVCGLAGTGSKDIVAREAFVPAHRVLLFADARSGTAPGGKYHQNPLYRMPLLIHGASMLASTAVGAARGALDAYLEMTRARKTRGALAGGQLPMAEFATIQLRYAEAAAAVESAELILLTDMRDMTQKLYAGEEITIADRIRCRRNQAWVTKLAVQAVEALNASTGGYGLHLSNPVQRAWRDANAVARHVSLNWDAVGTMYGQHAFGLEPRGQY
jgi:resorcinol 4-hydroxylase (FADH2)